MHEMEDGVRSGGGVVKKKNSSGCLIIKKKGGGTGGVGSSGSRKALESSKDRKRSRLVLSESESSEESSERFRRKGNSRPDRFHNGSAVYREDILQERKIGRNGEIEVERKRRLDVFEFDEYDGMDGKRRRKDYLQDRFKFKGRSAGEREFGAGSSQHVIIDNRKSSFYDSRSTSSGGRKELPDYTDKSRLEVEDDEAHLPLSSLRQKFRATSDEPIRLQGKNGVLKVMVNKKKKMDLPQNFFDHQLGSGDRKGSKSENAIKKNVSAAPSFNSDSKCPEKAIAIVKTEKSQLKLHKKPLSKTVKTECSETEDSDTSLRLGSTSVQVHSSSKAVKSQGKSPSAEKVKPVKGKEVKVKRGNGTEKQLLREKIRLMLVNAGWTIDYRPRRNRDYLDAVYINPTGTAYWSIIKAYDALQKQLDDEDVEVKPTEDSPSFAPLPDELLHKLTRQTRKKMEKEMKMKRKNHGRSKIVKVAAREESAEGSDGDKDDEKLSFFMKQGGKSPKGRSLGTSNGIGDDSNSLLHKGSAKRERAEKQSIGNNSSLKQGRHSRKFGRCTLLIRSSDKGLNSGNDGYVPYAGKRTLLSWLIDSGTVHLSEKVQYMNRRRTRVMLEGWITRDGIHCGCCSKILTILKFEIHAGSKLRQPFQNIFLESGVSLLQCQVDAWNKQEESERMGFHIVDTDGDDPNDDTCSLCGDGGDLICCDGCPSTFHQSCLDIQMLPPGDWHCPNCSCKFCGIAGTQGNHTTVSMLLNCDLCEKKYHESCSQEMDALPADLNRASTSFCGQKCGELFDNLQKLLGVKTELEAGFSWSLIRRTDLDIDASHRGFAQRVEGNSKLAVALSVMNECFLTIVDRRSKINLIHNVLYNCGSNFSRLNYNGFYTAILERGDEIISAASIRIHGTQLAEMPFIGTRHIYRRQGMCRRLFCALQSALSSLKVEKLIIPAISEHMHTWTIVFGFSPLEELHKKEMRSVNMLVFPGTDMIQKLLGEQKTDGSSTANSGAKSIHHLTPGLTRKSNGDSSSGHDLNISDDAGLQSEDEMDEKAAAVDSGLQTPSGSSNDNAPLSCSIDVSCEPKLKVSSEEKTTLHSVKNPTETSSDLPSYDLHHVYGGMENSFKGSSSEVVDDVETSNVKVAVIEPVLDSSGESSTMNATEVVNEDQNPLYKSAVKGNEETVKQSIADLSPRIAVVMECKLHDAPDVPSETQVVPGESNVMSSGEGWDDDAHHSKVQVASAGPVLVSLGGNSAEKIKEINDPGSVYCGIDPRVGPVEGNVHSSAASASGDSKSLGDIDGQNSTEEIDDKVNHVAHSNLRGTNETVMRFNCDLNHQSACEEEGEFPLAHEVSSEAELTRVRNNTESSAVGDMNDSLKVDDKEVNSDQDLVSGSTRNGNESTVRSNSDLNQQSTNDIQSAVASDMPDTHYGDCTVACVKLSLDYYGDIAAQNKDINEDQDLACVTRLHGSDESTVRFSPDLNKQNIIEVESNVHAASYVTSDEEVALGGGNVIPRAADAVEEADEVNVVNASIEPFVESSCATSAENASGEIKENSVLSTLL